MEKSLHSIVIELRDAVKNALPRGVEVTINASEEVNKTGTIFVVITDWPGDLFVNNRERVKANRQAILSGRPVPSGSSPRLPYISPEGNRLVETLQALVDRHCPPTWTIFGDVSFDPKTLASEYLAIVHSLKKSSKNSGQERVQS